MVALTLVEVGIDEIEQQGAAPTILYGFAHEEQCFLRSIMEFVYEQLVVSPRYYEHVVHNLVGDICQIRPQLGGELTNSDCKANKSSSYTLHLSPKTICAGQCRLQVAAHVLIETVTPFAFRMQFHNVFSQRPVEHQFLTVHFHRRLYLTLAVARTQRCHPRHIVLVLYN